MEINTYSEEFNRLWKLSEQKNHENYNMRFNIGELLTTSYKLDSIIFMGESHPYEPHKFVPVSYDGTNEYFIMPGSKTLIYVDKKIKYEEGN